MAPTSDVGRRAARLLQRLIRFDTTNPPGRERAAQEHLRDLLDDAGFVCRLVAADPERPNVVARLAGRSSGPTLCLLGHIDTVPAARDRWTVDPFAGIERDGCIWGRGAVDMKSQVAAEIIAAASLAEEGWRPPAGELLVVVTADEESGGALGARWLCREHPDLVRCDMVVNEGGGMALELGGRRVYGVAVGEKGVFRARIRTAGRDGHASLPTIGDNALVKLARLIAAIDGELDAVPTPEAAPLLGALGYEIDGDVRGALERLRSEHPRIAALVEPGLSVTISPTIVSASDKVNVIPGAAEVLVDCRAPVGFGAADVQARIEDLVGREGYTLRWERAEPGNRSPHDGVLMDHIRAAMTALDPRAELAPRLFAGFSDSHWFRAAFPHCTAYGFFPQRAMTEREALPLMHAADERIPVEDIALATRFYRDLVQRALS